MDLPDKPEDKILEDFRRSAELCMEIGMTYGEIKRAFLREVLEMGIKRAGSFTAACQLLGCNKKALKSSLYIWRQKDHLGNVTR